MIFESKVVVAFDQRGVAGARIARGPRGDRLVSRAFAPLEPGALQAGAFDDNVLRPQPVRDAVARLQRELGGNGTRAALVLPDGVARLALLEPPAGVKPAEFARFRLAQGLPFSVSEALVDGVLAPPGGFLAAAVRRSVVRGYEAVAAAAGLGQERVELLPLLALGSLMRRPETTGTLLAVVLSDAAFSLAFFEAGRLKLVRNRRRDEGGGDYPRLRDEILRTAAVAGADVVPRVVGFGGDAAELAAALRAERFDAAARDGGDDAHPSAWLEAALS